MSFYRKKCKKRRLFYALLLAPQLPNFHFFTDFFYNVTKLICICTIHNIECSNGTQLNGTFKTIKHVSEHVRTQNYKKNTIIPQNTTLFLLCVCVKLKHKEIVSVYARCDFTIRQVLEPPADPVAPVDYTTISNKPRGITDLKIHTLTRHDRRLLICFSL